MRPRRNKESFFSRKDKKEKPVNRQLFPEIEKEKSGVKLPTEVAPDTEEAQPELRK